MENKISRLKLLIHGQECDYSGNYKISDLMSKLSDLATINAKEIAIWNEEIAKKYTFVLTKETIILKRPIKSEELINLYTRASGYKRIQFSRNYWVEDENKEEIATIYSLWTLIDIQKRRIIKPDKAGIKMPKIISYPYALDNFHEIKDNLELSLVMERTVLYSDIDINFKEMSVIFKKEMTPNNKARIYRFIDNDYVKIVFKSSDDSIVYFEFGGYIGTMDY